MGKCLLCGRRIIFGQLDEAGYCAGCSKHIRDVEERKKRQEQIDNEKKAKMAAWIRYLPEYEISLSEDPYARQKRYESFDFVNITPKGSYSDIVVFDTETTGLAPSKDRIIELAAIKYHDGEPIEKYHSFVNPERSIPIEASKINHITDDMVASAPLIGQILPSFDKFIGESMLVAHNLEFDLKFIFYSGSKVLDVKRKYIDTLEQAHRLIKKDEVIDYSLSSLCDYYRIPMAQKHSALSDAFATGLLLFNLIEEKQPDFVYRLDPPTEALQKEQVVPVQNKQSFFTLMGG